uniref:Regulation of nuclear pre-mRNA domain-containing protein 2 n=1 Tax=Glossina brevipalpis TaxID=37001 RepID=A0A1A9W0E2_9MUSC
MANSRTTEVFDVDLFETRLESLKDTQDGIQQMSSWCLQQRGHHKKIVAAWLNVFKRVRVEHRLILFYLANDVIQYSKRKRYEFVESWATALQKATTMVRDEKVKNKILRIFNIWEQREIYSEEYLSDLCGLLNISPPKKSHTVIESDDFQNSNLVTSVRECVELSEMTDKSFKKLPKSPSCDINTIKQQLKDRSHSDDVEKEIERYITYIEAFNKNLQAEIKSRKVVLNNLDTAIKFYTNQRGEVKVVVSVSVKLLLLPRIYLNKFLSKAYKNFGSRIKLVKKKLDEISPNLPSPIPSPDVNAPSPEPDTDLQLPDEQTTISMDFLKSSFNGYSSYLDCNLPFDINDFKRKENSLKSSSQPIEVIGSRSDDENFNSNSEYYKTESISAYPGSNNVQIPGIPVPAVPSGGYTSLARAAQQYNDVLPPPPTPPIFSLNNSLTNNSIHHNLSSGYNALTTAGNYESNTGNYSTNSYNNGDGGGSATTMRPLMPPPPIPPSVDSLDTTTSSGGAGDFNSTWDMNMSWTNPLDSSNPSTSSYGQTSIDTPVSPPHFDREPLNSAAAPLEYSEHNSSLGATQDVDHRQLHLPPFGKLGLSKEKSRQLDIDHRNLISLTGSPGANDIDKKSWLSAADEFKSLSSGDVDYRRIGQNIKTIETTVLPSIPTTTSASTTSDVSEENMAFASNVNETSISSPQKDNKSPSADFQKDDTIVSASGGTSYDPTDMVVDMDMSDDDLEDIFREVNDQENEQTESKESKATNEDETNKEPTSTESAEQVRPLVNPPLLETPTEYGPPGVWEANMPAIPGVDNFVNSNNGADWNQMPWNNSIGRGGGLIPPPPRPPFPHMQFPYPSSSDNANPFVGGPMARGRRGGVRIWTHNQYRPFPRPSRGNAIGSPYFNRGAPRGTKFRGNFRGKNTWI